MMSNTGQRPAHPWRYAIGMFGITIPGQMYAAYASYYYSDTLKLGLQCISLGMILYAVWDAFNES